jgi:hypothetical protein
VHATGGVNKGFASGAFATACTMPQDVIKTRLQVQNALPAGTSAPALRYKYSKTLSMFSEIVKVSNAHMHMHKQTQTVCNMVVRLIADACRSMGFVGYSVDSLFGYYDAVL